MISDRFHPEEPKVETVGVDQDEKRGGGGGVLVINTAGKENVNEATPPAQ